MSASEPTTETATGNTFGKYRLVASVGHGGMADVYLAVAAGPAGVTKLQVLKRLRKNLAEEPEFLSMFLDEARLAARLNHPNVVQTNEVGQVDDDYFIAMEYLDGQPLNRILHAARARPAPPGFSLQIVAEALSGLHYAHELTDYDGTALGIVHRDTSPHNIFVTYEGQTKLVDFGIAKALRRTTETSVGTVKGKFAYMSPEQARCAAIDRRSDVFVMGIVLWEAVANRRMWKGQDELELIAKLIAGDVPKLADVCPDAPDAVVRICARALAHDPDDRYPTAAAMRHDLLDYLDEARLGVSSEKISEYLSDVFADKRAAMKKTIEQQLGRMARSMDVTAVSANAAPMSSSLPELGSGSTSRDPDLTPSKSRPTALGALSSSAVIDAPPAPVKGRSGLVIGGALVLGSALVAFAIYAGLGHSRAEPVAARSEALAAPPASSAAAPPPPSVAKIELRIHADPEAARIFLDDAELPANPFTGRFALDDLTHRLRVEAAGYTTRTQIITFARDTAMDVALAPTAAAPIVVKLAGHLPSATPDATAATTISPTTPTVQPKEKRALEDPWGDGTKAAPPKRSLDSADPFH
jgi:serine/threonine-protein kinase